MLPVVCCRQSYIKKEMPQALKQYAKEAGAPEEIATDDAREENSKEIKKFLNQIDTTLRIIEEGTPWANLAESHISLLKESVSKDMKESDCPLAFWDYCVERRARSNSLTSRDLLQLQGSNACTSLAGDEGDISSLCQFGWYNWCYFCEDKISFPFHKELLGKVLGPSK